MWCDWSKLERIKKEIKRCLLKQTSWLFFSSFSFALFCLILSLSWKILLQLDRKYARFSFLVDVWPFFLKKETWNPFCQNCITCILSIKSRSLKGKKLHGQFSYKPNENIVTRPFYNTRLSKPLIWFSLCVFVCVLLCGIHWNYGLN